MRPAAILETVLYVPDLAAAKAFYRDVIGLPVHAEVPGRHVFFRLDRQMLLLFDPAATRIPAHNAALPVPTHGSTGEGHVCFSATDAEIDTWRQHLLGHGIAIEADFRWPSGARSLYVRDPARNSVEFAERALWGLA